MSSVPHKHPDARETARKWNEIDQRQAAEIARLRAALRTAVTYGPPLDMWANQSAAKVVREALEAGGSDA